MTRYTCVSIEKKKSYKVSANFVNVKTLDLALNLVT